MRKGLIAWTLVLFVGFLAWKVVPFLRLARPDVAATPTVMPADPGSLVPVAVKHGQRACVDHMVFGPDMRYVAVTVLTTHPTGPIRVQATAPGYRATGTIAPGLGSNQQGLAAIAPARDDVAGGTLCLTNEGRFQVKLYGTNPGSRSGSLAHSTVDGQAAPGQISVTLLRSPSRSLWAQLGEVFDRVAAFRPISGWVAALLFGLLFLAAPVALGVALARAAGADDAAEAAAAEAGLPPAEPGW